MMFVWPVRFELQRSDGHALDSISEFYVIIICKRGRCPPIICFMPAEKSIFVCFFDVRRKINEVELLVSGRPRGIVSAKL